MAPLERWWATEPDEDPHGERVRFANAMDDLVDLDSADEELPDFISWLRREALSQEMYGQALSADPSWIEPLYVAYLAGRRGY